MGFLFKKKDNVTSENIIPKPDNMKKGAAPMNESQTVVLSYRTEDDLRSVCRKEIETLEHWTRRLIHETLSVQYGEDYFSYKNNDEPLIKGEIFSQLE